jgi:hypothetical protein
MIRLNQIFYLMINVSAKEHSISLLSCSIFILTAYP